MALLLIIISVARVSDSKLNQLTTAAASYALQDNHLNNVVSALKSFNQCADECLNFAFVLALCKYMYDVKNRCILDFSPVLRHWIKENACLSITSIYPPIYMLLYNTGMPHFCSLLVTRSHLYIHEY